MTALALEPGALVHVRQRRWVVENVRPPVGPQTGSAMKWPHHRNLRNRPPTPSKGRGPVQVRIRRAFLASGAEVGRSAPRWSADLPRLIAVRACARYGVLHLEQKCLRTNMEFVQ
jgi:hypothetical protein